MSRSIGPWVFSGLLALSSCADEARQQYVPPPIPERDATARDGDTGRPDAAPDGDAFIADVGREESSPPDAPRDDASALCEQTLRYVPPPGRLVSAVSLLAEWEAFQNPGTPLAGPRADGTFDARVRLAPGLHAYKVVVDGSAEFDPGSPLRKYVGGVENSALRVADCSLPTVSLVTGGTLPLTQGRGGYAARVGYQAGADGSALVPSSVRAVLRRDAVSREVPVTVDEASSTFDVRVTDLEPGKYTLSVHASDQKGRAAKPIRLVYWVEAEPFDFRDGLMYMIMTDRFVNGDRSNDPKSDPSVDPRADFQGGDLMGVRQKIADGTLERLGVRVLWLSPFHENVAGPYLASDGKHLTMPYHGYWPVKARTVDARIGGDRALKEMVAEAHARGIRVLADFVVNHVHKDHEYAKAHPEWFRTGCVCGTDGCGWTDHRLDCLFSDYLPDVNWSVTEASEQFIADAIHWVDEFDLDGLRIDAVKHVEDLAVMNMATALRSEFEASGTRLFLTGETAMGWAGDDVAANKSEYDTIRRYIGPSMLDGQIDFVLYHAAAYRTFAYGDKGLLHADFWAKQSSIEFGTALMTPYIGSHDSERFVTLATYRGQDAESDRSIPSRKWDNVAAAPSGSEPYARHRVALSWLAGLPGLPLLYYGDEYGEWGGADPNNRHMWRPDATLNAEEAATLSHVRLLGQARKELVALRRGAYRTVHATESALVFARQHGSEVALVALSTGAQPTSVRVSLPPTLGLAEGTRLRDYLGGAAVDVSSGTIALSLPSWGTAIYAK